LENPLSDREKHQHCTGRIIELANTLKDEGHDTNLVSASLMAASGVYATYAAAGNEGALEPSGVQKITAMYTRNLEHIQEQKKMKANEAAGVTSEEVSETDSDLELVDLSSEED
jgi:hypothetical protein